MNVVAYIDVGPEVGYGHLVRCMALLDELAELRDLSCVVFARGGVAQLPFTSVCVPSGLSASATAEFILARSGAIDVLLVDLCRPTEPELAAFEGGSHVVVHIDDDTKHLFDCDLLINPNLSTDFVHRRTARTQYLTGGSAILLRRQFVVPPRREIEDRLKHLLLCFGGSDSTNVTATVVNSLRTCWPEELERVNVVVGAGYTYGEQLARVIGNDPRFSLRTDVKEMSALMHDSDAAILAGGTLLYEALAAGLPALIIGLNDAQAREALTAERCGAATYLGGPELISPARIASFLSDLEDSELRLRISTRAQSLLDGRGAARAAARIVRLVAGG